MVNSVMPRSAQGKRQKYYVNADVMMKRSSPLFRTLSVPTVIVAAPETLEERIVYDADKLDSLGAFGVARSFHFAGRIGARLHNSREEAINSEAYSREDTAYREYLVKLRYLPEKMLTATGAEMAKKRAEFMFAFFDELEKESVAQE